MADYFGFKKDSSKTISLDTCCPKLTYKQRIYGFIGCGVIGKQRAYTSLFSKLFFYFCLFTHSLTLSLYLFLLFFKNQDGSSRSAHFSR